MEVLHDWGVHPDPVVIECVVDPNEPPMPGKVKAEQAWHFAESIVKGAKSGAKLPETMAGDSVRELV
jgi:hypothetical protein